MPMYKPPTATSPPRLVMMPPSPRGGAGEEEDLWSPLPSAPSTRPSSPKPAHSRTVSRESSRFFRRLNRWTGLREGGSLDFGCAGEWSEGPADMGDRFYSSYPGGAHRASTSSSSDVPSPTHSRGHSTSSTFSASTAASSIPPSPTQACHPSISFSSSSADLAPPLSPYASRVPLTPRTAQRKRQSDENAAVDALNEYFTRVRLSQIEEDVIVSPRASMDGGAFHADGSSASGLAIFGSGAAELEVDFEPAARRKQQVYLPPPVPPKSKVTSHSRGMSHDLEIQFLETGDTTYTPLSVDPAADDHLHFTSTFLLPEETFSFPLPPSGASPSARSTFAASESNESHESGMTATSLQTGETSSTSTTILRHRSPIPEHAIGPALDELSQYFISSSSSSSSGYSPSPSPPPTVRNGGHAQHVSLPSLIPPAPISPQRRQSARFASPRLHSASPAPAQRPLYSYHKRQSSSFAAAQRARMVQSGLASPNAQERRGVAYDWI
ncbi:hypothetical protein JCM10213v2_003381 [Rhodosporidiobolus nylandii]